MRLHEAEAEEPLVAELQRVRDPRVDPAPRRSSGWVLSLPTSFAEFRRTLPTKARGNLNHAGNVARRTLGGLAEERVSLYLFATNARGRWLRTSRAAVGWLEGAARATLGGRLARRLRRALPGSR